MTGREVLLKAAELPLDDETWETPRREWATKWDGGVSRRGGGLVCALKAAAGDDLLAYQDAQAMMDEYCDARAELWPSPGWRGRLYSAISTWASDKTPEERRALLVELAG